MVICSSAMIPVFAEVMSLQTNQPFYTHGNKIYFRGTVGIGDYQKLVNLVIHDPLGKFVLISGNYSDSTYTFEMVVNTNNTAQFSTKGTYQAIAFVGKESDGKTLNFDFSPDGSPVIHQIPPSTNTPETSNSNQSLPQHYQSQLNENIGLADTTENLTKAVIPKIPEEKSLKQVDYKNVLYPLISICGAGIVITILYVRKRSSTKETKRRPSIQQPHVETDLANLEDDYAVMILKNRLAKGEITVEEFKAIKNELDEP